MLTNKWWSVTNNQDVQPRGELWSWGSNDQGQLGIGVLGGDVLTPTKVGSATNWTSVSHSRGSYFSLGLKSNGTLWSWGANAGGQTGQGTDVGQTLVPTQVGSATNWVSVAASRESGFSLGLQADGSLWSWGDNIQGVTGQGTNVGNTLVPTQVGSNTNWVSVTAAAGCSFGIQSDGTLWAWGANAGGQTGQGTDVGQTLVPTQVGSATNWVSVTAGTSYVFGIQSDGSLWSWGYNTNGVTGLGTDAGNTTTPTQVGSATWLSVAAGPISSHSLGIQSDGSLWSWGFNGLGVTGLGTDVGTTLVPTQVGSNTNWVSVAAVRYASFGLQSNGSLWSWGSNADGRTGLGTSSGDTLVPTQVGSNTNWVSVAANRYAVFGIQSDGSLWSWGDNANGATGLGTDAGYTLAPTQVGSATNWVSVVIGYRGVHGIQKK